MRELEHRVEGNRIEREAEEKKLQKEVDSLRGEYSKVVSEKDLKEVGVVEAREEISRIKSQITQVLEVLRIDRNFICSRDFLFPQFGAAANRLNSIEASMQVIKNKMQQLNEELNVEDAKKEVQDKIKLRDETEAFLSAVDEEISSLLKQSSLQAELKLHKDTLLAKEKEIEGLRNKHESTIKSLFDIKELSQVKLKNNLETTQKELVIRNVCSLLIMKLI